MVILHIYVNKHNGKKQGFTAENTSLVIDYCVLLSKLLALGFIGYKSTVLKSNGLYAGVSDYLFSW